MPYSHSDFERLKQMANQDNELPTTTFKARPAPKNMPQSPTTPARKQDVEQSVDKSFKARPVPKSTYETPPQGSPAQQIQKPTSPDPPTTPKPFKARQMPNFDRVHSKQKLAHGDDDSSSTSQVQKSVASSSESNQKQFKARQMPNFERAHSKQKPVDDDSRSTRSVSSFNSTPSPPLRNYKQQASSKKQPSFQARPLPASYKAKKEEPEENEKQPPQPQDDAPLRVYNPPARVQEDDSSFKAKPLPKSTFEYKPPPPPPAPKLVSRRQKASAPMESEKLDESVSEATDMAIVVEESGEASAEEESKAGSATNEKSTFETTETKQDDESNADSSKAKASWLFSSLFASTAPEQNTDAAASEEERPVGNHAKDKNVEAESGSRGEEDKSTSGESLQKPGELEGAAKETESKADELEVSTGETESLFSAQKDHGSGSPPLRVYPDKRLAEDSFRARPLPATTFEYKPPSPRPPSRKVHRRKSDPMETMESMAATVSSVGSESREQQGSGATIESSSTRSTGEPDASVSPFRMYHSSPNMAVLGQNDDSSFKAKPLPKSTFEYKPPPPRPPPKLVKRSSSDLGPAVDDSSFKAKPLPKSTFEYKPPPPPPPPKLVKRSSSDLRPEAGDDSSFKAKPLPKSTFEYKAPPPRPPPRRVYPKKSGSFSESAASVETESANVDKEDIGDNTELARKEATVAVVDDPFAEEDIAAEKETDAGAPVAVHQLEHTTGAPLEQQVLSAVVDAPFDEEGQMRIDEAGEVGSIDHQNNATDRDGDVVAGDEVAIVEEQADVNDEVAKEQEFDSDVEGHTVSSQNNNEDHAEKPDVDQLHESPPAERTDERETDVDVPRKEASPTAEVTEDSGRSAKDEPSSPFLVRLSMKRILKNLAAALLLPYIGVFSVLEMERHHYLETLVHQQSAPVEGDGSGDAEDGGIGGNVNQHAAMLPKQPRKQRFPRPLLPKGKRPPRAVYTSHAFVKVEADSSAAVDAWSQQRIDVHLYHNESSSGGAAAGNDSEGENGFFEPAGQHLLLDISNVNPSFLSDVELLAQSMVSIAEESQLTLLSYHCHEWKSKGVSCLGVLLESHISVHTWPSAGILSLDLFTCGSTSLLPLVAVVRDLFAIRPDNSDSELLPSLRWLHKKRGFRGLSADPAQPSSVNKVLPAELGQKSVDMEAYLLGWMGYSDKQLLSDVQTRFQQVQIYETQLLAAPPLSRENQTNDVPNRANNKLLYLDGGMRSSLHGLEAYHEALVQPALFAHRLPQRVAILGGGEGATLREVLKHKTVREVVMVEQDESLVNLAREYLTEWNDCSNLQGKSTAFSCFDDLRVQLHLEDGIPWFLDRYGENATKTNTKFDVIVLDAFDPASVVGGKQGNDFVSALTNALAAEGVLVSQVGKEQKNSAASGDGLNEFWRLLHANGAQLMKTYTESHGQLLGPWEFRVIFMSKHVPWWLETGAASLSLQMAVRTPPSLTGRGLFDYFDEATFLASYQYSGRSAASEHTLGGFDPDLTNIPVSVLGVKTVSLGRREKRKGVFVKTKKAYAEGSFFLLEEIAHRMIAMPDSIDLIRRVLLEFSRKRRGVHSLMGGCAAQGSALSSCHIVVDQPQITSFLDCNPTALHLRSSYHAACSNTGAFFHPHVDRDLAAIAARQVNRLTTDARKGTELVLTSPCGDGWPSWLFFMEPCQHQ